MKNFTMAVTVVAVLVYVAFAPEIIRWEANQMLAVADIFAKVLR